MLAAAVLVAVVLCAPAVTLAAPFYRWVDEDGTVHYTQSPPPVRSAPRGPERPAPPQSAAAAVDEVLELSGLKLQLAQLPQQLLAQAPQLQSDLSPQDRATVLRGLAGAFRLEV